jgi:hypothetical protein
MCTESTEQREHIKRTNPEITQTPCNDMHQGYDRYTLYVRRRVLLDDMVLIPINMSLSVIAV